MSLEIRFMIFSEDEILMALDTYAERAKQDFPRSGKRALKVSERNEALQFKVVDQHDWTIRNYYEPELIAALILLHRDLKIPMPRKGRKTLKIINGQVALQIKTDVDLRFKVNAIDRTLTDVLRI